jgi:hypothetical protein
MIEKQGVMLYKKALINESFEGFNQFVNTKYKK